MRKMAGDWVMKTFQCSLVKLLMIAIAYSFTPSATVQAGASSASSAPPNNVALRAGNARLFVWRAADFGTEIYLTLYIDGVHVTTLGRNEGYEAILRPGEHVFSIGTTPCPYGKTKFTYRRVNVKRGQTYAFTALWEWADYATLETSDAAKVPGRPLW